MKAFGKKALAFSMILALAGGTIAGCSKIKSDDVIVTVGDRTMEAQVANFYIRYQQATMETSYGSFMGGADMWKQDASEGKTYAETIKEDVAKSLGQLYLLEDHMKEYNVELSEEEKTKIKEAEMKFLEANSEEAKAMIMAEDSSVSRIMELLTIQNKMYTAMTADVNTEVTDEEAAQKSMQYVKFAFTTTDAQGNSTELDEAGKADLKTKAEAFLEGAKSAEDFAVYATESGYEASTSTFDKDSTAPEAGVVEVTDALAEGGVSQVIETEAGYYVAKVTSLLDREATDKKKETIVNQRKKETYDKLLADWEKETKITINKSNLKKIDFTNQGITLKQPEAAAE